MARATNPTPETPETPAPGTPAELTVDEVAAQLAQLIGADLNMTLAVLAGQLKYIRETFPQRMPAVKAGSDALRIESEKWYASYKKARETGNDPTKALLAAGAAAMNGG